MFCFYFKNKNLTICTISHSHFFLSVEFLNVQRQLESRIKRLTIAFTGAQYIQSFAAFMYSVTTKNNYKNQQFEGYVANTLKSQKKFFTFLKNVIFDREVFVFKNFFFAILCMLN